jgi:HD-like signal output (HDOD) protein
VDRNILRSLDLGQRLNGRDFEELARKTRVESLPARRQLFVRGRRDDWAFYLLEGTVRLEDSAGSVTEVVGGTEAARAPLADDQPRSRTATALTPIRFIRVHRDLLEVFTGGAGAYGVDEIREDAAKGGERLFHRIYHEYMAETLELPHLPDVALRVRQAAQSEDCDAAKIARIIQTDPVLAAKLIKAANSPLYGVQTPITSCRAAVLFLGLETTRNLVLSYTLRDLFKTDSALLRERMSALWAHSARVGALGYLLAGLTPGLDQERGLLAGLLHDIGVLPIIHYAARFPELARDADQLEEAIAELRGQVGAMLLRQWQFGDELVGVVLEAEAWQRDPGPHADYADLILVAQRLGEEEAASLPAYAKLARGRLDAELETQLLAEAEQEVTEALGLFG